MRDNSGYRQISKEWGKLRHYAQWVSANKKSERQVKALCTIHVHV